MKKGEKTLSQIVGAYSVIILVLFIGLLVYTNVFVLAKLRESEVEIARETLDRLANVWDSKLSDNAVFIQNTLANNNDIVKLETVDSHEEQIYAMQDIQASLNEYVLLNNGIVELFFYSSSRDVYLSVLRDSVITGGGMVTKDRIKSVMQAYEAAGGSGGWVLTEVNGVSYLIFISSKGNDYMGCWCSVDYLLDIAEETTGESAYYFVTDAGGVSQTDNYRKGESFSLQANTFYDAEAQVAYMQVAEQSEMVDMYFCGHLERGEAEQSLIRIRNIMLFIVVLTVVFMIFGTRFMEKWLYRPVRNLVAHMLLVSDENLESRITQKSRLREIRILNETYNKMLDEIKDLKISVYEEQLKEQKVRMLYLQQQIKPHFLDNALNSVCAMIDTGKSDSAREMCSYLMQYFRFLYSKTTELITLDEELQQVQAYLRIQEMRRPGKIEYHCHVDDKCRICPLPPLTLLTFVENSFKYGIDLESQVNTFSIEAFSEDACTVIIVRDEGPGFRDCDLENIRNARPTVKNDRESVGIVNVIERLKIFFGDRVGITVYNEDGAVVEIRIPDEC